MVSLVVSSEYTGTHLFLRQKRDESVALLVVVSSEDIVLHTQKKGVCGSSPVSDPQEIKSRLS